MESAINFKEMRTLNSLWLTNLNAAPGLMLELSEIMVFSDQQPPKPTTSVDNLAMSLDLKMAEINAA